MAPEHPGISTNPYLMGPAAPGCSCWDKRHPCVPHLEGKKTTFCSFRSPEKAANPLGLTQQLLCHRLRQAPEPRQGTSLIPGHAAVWHREGWSRNGDVGAVSDPSERGGCLAGSQQPSASLIELSLGEMVRAGQFPATCPRAWGWPPPSAGLPKTFLSFNKKVTAI